MPDYRRCWTPGGTYFFTVALWRRHGNDLLVRHVDALREAVRAVKARHPFVIHGWVVLPDHLHCVLELPAEDADFALRWRLIKMTFSKRIASGESLSSSRTRRKERGIWQRRYWEHRIRDEADLARHLDYLHYNPVKHGHVERVAEWPYSSFHRYVRQGILPRDWAGEATPR
ncbi:transposase [Chromobacterium sp. ATCC 53434]|uniref:REP-associated tyrosine transposase n=1 Tax=Chromobacterium sp. (strain ATCC 53434 / SC 14030) TaxID=2059672 RepID=UPI000C78E6A9|nr:transposase [Chromobacterium sp. ATCC 53434]AUH53044.1 transposase [Chromobacterium sp. ATCC 53434]